MAGNKRAAASGPNSTSFSVGSEPWNKGLTGLHLSPETEFKPGHSMKWKYPVGTVKIRKCKNGNRRAFIKIAEPNSWRLNALVVWEGENGPIPAGMVLHHVDHDMLNDCINNLAILTRAQHINEHRNDLRSI